MRKIGYCRVSREEQNLDRQIDALTEAGCEFIYQEKQSGNNKRLRPEFEKMMAEVLPGDTVIVQKLDRFGRSMLHLLSSIEILNKKSVAFKSLTDGFDASNINGRLMMNMLASFAQFEREMISERTKDCLRVLKKNGVVLGRPVGKEKMMKFAELVQAGKNREAIQEELMIKKRRYYQMMGQLHPSEQD